MKKKVYQNGTVATLTNGNITSLENLVDEFKRAKSVGFISAEDF